MRWLIFLIISSSCSLLSYFESHPKELQDIEKIGEDSVKLVEDIVEGK